MIRAALLLVVAPVLASCSCGLGGGAADGGGSGGQDSAHRDAGPPGICGTSPARITGTVFAPNGVDPIPNVLVYATENERVFPPPPARVQCQRCNDAVEALAWTYAGGDGTFVLTGGLLDPGGTFAIVFETGGFRHVERGVVLERCGTIALDAAQTSLPGANGGDDTIPRIAVASDPGGADVWDQFALVLDAIGIRGYERIDPDRSGPPDGMLALLADRDRLWQYQIVVVPCGSIGGFSVSANLTPPIVANVQDWLAAGGRLYASDLAYSIIEQPFPGAIDFAPGPSPNPRADPAIVGVGVSGALTASIDDPALLGWLQLVGAVPPGGTTIPVRDLRDPWGAIDRIPPERLVPDAMGIRHAVVWVSGDVAWHVPGGGRHPLTVGVDHPGAGGHCGRVVYTSYHVETGGGGALSPQERVLEYLFFQLSSCIPTII